MKLSTLKSNGVKTVMLNGFKESLEYVMSLSHAYWVEEVKSADGYNTIHCYETK